MKLVSEGTLEKVKHSFRLSQRYIVDERGRGRDKEDAHRRSLALLKQQVGLVDEDYVQAVQYSIPKFIYV